MSLERVLRHLSLVPIYVWTGWLCWRLDSVGPLLVSFGLVGWQLACLWLANKAGRRDRLIEITKRLEGAKR